METVTNIVSTAAGVASRAIWGDGEEKKESETLGQEPLAGEVGQVQKGEPYDKGNVEDLATADSTPAPTSNLKVIDTTAPSVPSASEGLVPKSQDPTVPAVNASTSKSTDAKLVKELPARPTEVFEAGPGEVTNDTKTEIEGSTTTGTTKSIDETAALASATAGVGSMSLDKESVGTGVIKGRESGNPSTLPETTGFQSESISAPAPPLTAATSPTPSTGSSAREQSTDATPDSPPSAEKKSLKEKMGIDKLKSKLHLHKDKE